MIMKRILIADDHAIVRSGLKQLLSGLGDFTVAGEASSHCVLKTVQQIADNIGKEHIKKFHLLR